MIQSHLKFVHNTKDSEGPVGFEVGRSLFAEHRHHVQEVLERQAAVGAAGVNVNNQGSMLWSQFSAIFDNFLQKIGVFSKTDVMINF
jgi:hypothetical protein